jgi:hypothetical protein
MSYTKKERQQYNQMRENVCKNLNITKNNYNWLRRKGEALRKIYEYQCNGQDDQGQKSDRTQARWERWENKHYEDVRKYVEKLKLYVYFQTDPRGATIYVDNKLIPSNNYSNAYCIY